MLPSNTLPLVRFHTPKDVIAHRENTTICIEDFLGDVFEIAQQLAGKHDFILNFCQDRYRFLVTFAAGLIANKISLLPSTRTPAALQQIRNIYPNVVCIHDGGGLGELVTSDQELDIPLLHFQTHAGSRQITKQQSPEIPCDQIVAYVFTSGSTGMPVAHPKRWDSLVHAAQAEASVLDLEEGSLSVVGTVPSQHQYGLESLVMLTLQCGAQLWAGHPFYPVDIAQALAQMPAPRVLVTTPVHLRALLNDEVKLPPVARILSATAPLSQEMAIEAEQRFECALVEKYGCTETGLLASRSSAKTTRWSLFPKVVIENRDGVFWASGGHIPEPMQLADILDFSDPSHFVLCGRNSDLVNISGKRSSLGHLNHQLLSIEGIEDGCMFVPKVENRHGQVEDSVRLCAFVVSSKLTTSLILKAMRNKIDPAFLPRPLIQLPRLPRNETGKLPNAALQALYDAHVANHGSAQPNVKE